MGYKKSKFNYVTRTNNGVIIYNTLYNSLSRLSELEYQQYQNGERLEDELLQLMVSQGILVRDNIDEAERYNIFSRLSNKYFRGIPAITVTPTMECNARCFYCYENGVRNGRLREEDISAIVDKIKLLDTSNGINITWFGGEPLLNTKWMDAFAYALKEENITFVGFMITNGSKLDSEIIKKMIDVWNVNCVQITLDGSYEEYVKRKAYTNGDKNIYYRLLKNIGKIAKVGIDVRIRLNIDALNAESIIQAAKDIEMLYGGNLNVSYYPAFLTGTKYQMSEEDKLEIIRRLIEVGSNFHISDYIYKTPRTIACYHYQDNAFSIDTNGCIYTCEHMLGHKEKAVGNINEKIDISSLERIIPEPRSECVDCVFWPKCNGGCYDSLINGEDACFIDKYIIKAYLDML